MDKLERVEDAIPFELNSEDNSYGLSSSMMNWILPSSSDEPAYWSPARDKWLRSYWKDVDALKTAVTTFVDKTLSIPFTIHPKDHSVQRHVDLARSIDSDMRINSGTISQGPMRGLKDAMTPFVIDYLTQDNGAFLFIMGNGDASEPIIGRPIGFLHLDSSRCQRTGNPLFPIVYIHDSESGTTYHKIHYTRIIDMSHLSSPDSDMYGVGLCPVSCCTMAAGEISDIYRFSQEKFGSRPPRQILYAKTGATVEMLTSAIQHWQGKLDNEQRTHFGGTLVVAPRNAAGVLELDVLELSSAPDGFNRQESIMQDKAEIAASFGLDLLDLAMSFGIQGQTRANADVQTRKGRGKGPGALIEALIDKINSKYLPNSLIVIADNVDDDQDQQRASIMDVRSQAYARQLQFQIRDERSTRKDMLNSNEITQSNFEELELMDGRLPSGISVLSLFYSDNEMVKEWLDLGVEDPTNIYDNDSESILKSIYKARKDIWSFLNIEMPSEPIVLIAKRSLAALSELEKEYKKIGISEQEEEADGSNDMSARKIERSEIRSDNTERQVENNGLPQDNLMKEISPQWIDENIDPYSLTEDQVASAIDSFNQSNTEYDGILEAEVI